MAEPMSSTRSYEVVTGESARLAVSPARAVRRWSAEEKQRIVTATFAPGANVSAIARTHQIDVSQLFAWRRKALASGAVRPIDEEPRRRAVKFERYEASDRDMMELVIGDVTVRVSSDVELDRLAGVIRAVRQA